HSGTYCRLTKGNLRRAGCTVMGTSGSEGGPEKRAGSNPGTALRLDPYFRIRWKPKKGSAKWYVYTFIADRPVRALKAKIRALTPRTSQQALAHVRTRLGQIRRGGANYYKHAVPKWPFSKLAAFPWGRLPRMRGARHRWNWGQLRRHLTAA